MSLSEQLVNILIWKLFTWPRYYVKSIFLTVGRKIKSVTHIWAINSHKKEPNWQLIIMRSGFENKLFIVMKRIFSVTKHVMTRIFSVDLLENNSFLVLSTYFTLLQQKWKYEFDESMATKHKGANCVTFPVCWGYVVLCKKTLFTGSVISVHGFIFLIKD